MANKQCAKALVLALVLFLVFGAAAVGLNFITGPIIEKNAASQASGALAKVLPGAKGFEEVDLSTLADIPDTVVSMNCWGFTPDIFAKAEEGFARFLDADDGNIKREYYLPFAVREIMAEGGCNVRVYRSEDSWYGVTYKEDHEHVSKSLTELKRNGVYASRLSDMKL